MSLTNAPPCQPVKSKEADTFSPELFEPVAGSTALSPNLSQAPFSLVKTGAASKQTEKRSKLYERTLEGFNLILLPVAEPEMGVV